MIGSFPIHIAGLIAVFIGILLLIILSIACLVIYSFMLFENKRNDLWVRALMRSAFLLTVLNILFSLPLISIFASFYETLSNLFKFNFEKNKDLYDGYLSCIWIILLIIVWILIGKNWRNILEKQ